MTFCVSRCSSGFFCISDFGQVQYLWECLHIFKCVVTALVVEELVDFGVLIVEVSKDNSIGGAGLLTSRFDFAVVRIAHLRFGDELLLLDTLHAEGAFFHDPSGTHGHVRIQHQTTHFVVLRWIDILELIIPVIAEPVEAAHFVGTVVGAVAGADAAVVDLLVQTFVAVRSCEHWTD